MAEIETGTESESEYVRFDNVGLISLYWAAISGEFNLATGYDDDNTKFYVAVHKSHLDEHGGYFPDALKGVGSGKGNAIRDWIHKAVPHSVWSKELRSRDE